MRASRADRDRALEVIQTSFVAGRLTKEELDLRVGQALVTPFFAELMALTADLPVGPFGRLPAHPVTPAYPRSAGDHCAGLCDDRPAERGDHRHPGHRRGAPGAPPDPADRRAGQGSRRPAVALGWLTLLIAVLCAVLAG